MQDDDGDGVDDVDDVDDKEKGLKMNCNGTHSLKYLHDC